MLENNTGHIVGVNGNMLTVEFESAVTQNEVAFAVLGDIRLKSEVIRVRGNRADLQVYESTAGLKVGDTVEFTSDLLSVELGPGLLTQVYDGLQNPLNKLAEKSGFFLQRGVYIHALDYDREWEFTPTAKVGDRLTAGSYIGYVPEGIFKHYIMLPFLFRGTWELVEVAEPGPHKLLDCVAKAKNEKGEIREITMVQKWPVKIPISCYKEKLLPVDPLTTQVRSIDTFFPVAQGGTFCTPGPFGAGKTVLQHAISQHAEADVVIIAACGTVSSTFPPEEAARLPAPNTGDVGATSRAGPLRGYAHHPVRVCTPPHTSLLANRQVRALARRTGGLGICTYPVCAVHIPSWGSAHTLTSPSHWALAPVLRFARPDGSLTRAAVPESQRRRIYLGGCHGLGHSDRVGRDGGRVGPGARPRGGRKRP